MRLRIWLEWLRKSRGGATAVEFAVTAPILVSMLYGIVELSHYAWSNIALADAAKMGARYAMVRGSASADPASASDIATYVKGQIVLIDPNAVTVSTTFTPDNKPGSDVTVSLSYSFVPFLPGFDYLTTKRLTASSEMTISD